VKEIKLRSAAKQEILDVTLQVAEVVRAGGVDEGFCHLFVPHTTAGLSINENADPDVKRDVLHALTKLVPEDGNFRHQEGNSPAHVKSVLTGSAVTLFIRAGRLDLGSWGGIYFCEFDGPRSRRLLVGGQGQDAQGRWIQF